jgi:hypothetical protein
VYDVTPGEISELSLTPRTEVTYISEPVQEVTKKPKLRPKSLTPGEHINIHIR